MDFHSPDPFLQENVASEFDESFGETIGKASEFEERFGEIIGKASEFDERFGETIGNLRVLKTGQGNGKGGDSHFDEVDKPFGGFSGYMSNKVRSISQTLVV